jgi:hypothetical protein
MRCWMNKSDLKKLIKPVVKECIHEVLLEEGLLSNVVSEVAKGMQGSMVLESAPKTVVNTNMPSQHKIQESRAKLKQHREKLMNSINSDAYNGVNLFEGTEPMTAHESAQPKAGSVDLGSPADAGVDISSLMGGASKIWNAMK